jgi:hypothetical protein
MCTYAMACNNAAVAITNGAIIVREAFQMKPRWN